jgi:hypothetical protein
MKLGRDLWLAVMVLGIGLVACKKFKSESSSTETSSGDKSGVAEKAAEPATTGGDPLGVPACDDFLAKWEKCVAKYPAPAQEMTRLAIKQTREGWRQAVATPAGKAAMEAPCKQMLESQKQATAAYGCEW